VKTLAMRNQAQKATSLNASFQKRMDSSLVGRSFVGDEPIKAKSSTDRDEPSRATPNNEGAEPRRAKPRKDKPDPSRMKSSTDDEDPNCTMP